MRSPHPPSISHDEAIKRLLTGNPDLARELVQVASEEATDAAGLAVLTRVLRHVADAHGMAKTAAGLGTTVRKLTHELSDRGNPTLKTLLGITQVTGTTITLSPRVPIEEARPPRVVRRKLASPKKAKATSDS